METKTATEAPKLNRSVLMKEAYSIMAAHKAKGQELGLGDAIRIVQNTAEENEELRGRLYMTKEAFNQVFTQPVKEMAKESAPVEKPKAGSKSDKVVVTPATEKKATPEVVSKGACVPTAEEATQVAAISTLSGKIICLLEMEKWGLTAIAKYVGEVMGKPVSYQRAKNVVKAAKKNGIVYKTH